MSSRSVASSGPNALRVTTTSTQSPLRIELAVGQQRVVVDGVEFDGAHVT